MLSEQSQSISSVHTDDSPNKDSDSHDDSIVSVSAVTSDESGSPSRIEEFTKELYSSIRTTETLHSSTSENHYTQKSADDRNKSYSSYEHGVIGEESDDGSSSRTTWTRPTSASSFAYTTTDNDDRSLVSDALQYASFSTISRNSADTYNSSDESRDQNSEEYCSDYSEEDYSDTFSEDEETKAESVFIKRCIDKFQSSPPSLMPTKKRAAAKLHYDPTEMNAAAGYCEEMAKRLSLARNSSEQKPESSTHNHNFGKRTTLHERRWKKVNELPASDCGVSPNLLSKFRLENCLMRLRKESDPLIHQHHETCQECKEKHATVEKQEFLQRKANFVQSRVIEEKLSNVNLMPDPIMMLGEIARDLPKLSDDPKDIMDKLLLPLKSRSDQPQP